MTMTRDKMPVSMAKAKKIMHDGMIKGKKLTKKQKGYFGAMAGGSRVNVR